MKRVVNVVMFSLVILLVVLVSSCRRDHCPGALSVRPVSICAQK